MLCLSDNHRKSTEIIQLRINISKLNDDKVLVMTHRLLLFVSPGLYFRPKADGATQTVCS